MDETHLTAALRYVALNPVKARLAARAAALVAGRSTPHVDVAPALARTGDFAAFLAGGGDETRWRALLDAETVGRPVGAQDWISALEAWLGLPLTPQKRGPKPKAAHNPEVSNQATLPL